jgi:hypothetical protein
MNRKEESSSQIISLRERLRSICPPRAGKLTAVERLHRNEKFVLFIKEVLSLMMNDPEIVAVPLRKLAPFLKKDFPGFQLSRDTLIRYLEKYEPEAYKTLYKREGQEDV